jgi:hypothetical protein
VAVVVVWAFWEAQGQVLVAQAGLETQLLPQSAVVDPAGRPVPMQLAAITVAVEQAAPAEEQAPVDQVL